MMNFIKYDFFNYKFSDFYKNLFERNRDFFERVNFINSNKGFEYFYENYKGKYTYFSHQNLITNATAFMSQLPNTTIITLEPSKDYPCRQLIE